MRFPQNINTVTYLREVEDIHNSGLPFSQYFHYHWPKSVNVSIFHRRYYFLKVIQMGNGVLWEYDSSRGRKDSLWCIWPLAKWARVSNSREFDVLNLWKSETRKISVRIGSMCWWLAVFVKSSEQLRFIRGHGEREQETHSLGT
jgi:hypothetical protein